MPGNMTRQQVGSRRHLAVLGLAFSLLLGIANPALAEGGSRVPPSPSEKAKAPNDAAAKPAGKAAWAPAKVANPPFRAYPDKMGDRCYEDGEHDRADLCAQWRAALAAERAAKSSQWANCIAILSLLLSLGGFIALIRTLVLARQSNDTNREIGQAQTRCYLSLEAVRLYIDDTDSKPRLMVALRNSGASPALDVMWSAILTYRCPDAAVGRESPSFKASALRVTIAPNTSFDITPVALDYPLAQAERAAVVQADRSLGIEVAVTVTATDVFGEAVTVGDVFSGLIQDLEIWMALTPNGSKPVRSVEAAHSATT